MQVFVLQQIIGRSSILRDGFIDTVYRQHIHHNVAIKNLRERETIWNLFVDRFSSRLVKEMTKEGKVGGKFWQVLLFLLFMEWLCRSSEDVNFCLSPFFQGKSTRSGLNLQKCLPLHHKSKSVKNDREFCERLSDWKRFCWSSRNWRSNSISHTGWPQIQKR